MITDNRYTTPRSFGVYELPQSVRGTKRFRFGNHPIRMEELRREFGECTLLATYTERSEALTEATNRNAAT